MGAHFILKPWGIYFWMKLSTYPMLFHNTSRLQLVNPCYIGYTCANCVIKQKQLQAMLVNTLSNNIYQHIMAIRILVYFWVEIAFISLSFAHNSQIANMILAKCQRSATFVERCFQFHKEFYKFKCHNWWKCAFSFLKIRNLI